MDILVLNDYCLEEILKYLRLTEQIKNTAVCSRFKNVIQGIWRRNTKKTSIQCSEFSEEEIESYFSQIHYNLEEVEFESLSLPNIATLTKYVYPKVTALTCTTLHTKRGKSDEVTLMLTRSFPNLTKLSLESRITAQFIDSFTNLEDLNLSCCEYLQTNYLSRVFTKLKLKKLTMLYYGYYTTVDINLSDMHKCTTLEELILDDYHLLSFIDILESFENLKLIACYTRDYTEYLLSKLTDYYGKKVTAFYFNNCLWARLGIVSTLLELVNLEKLYLYDDNLENSQMKSIALGNHNLREIHYVDCKSETVSGLLNFVRHCNKLEVLNLYGTKITSSKFIQKMNDIISSKYTQRPLKVYFGGTTTSKDIFNNIKDLSPMFQYSFAVYSKPKITYKGFCFEIDQNLS